MKIRMKIIVKYIPFALLSIMLFGILECGMVYGAEKNTDTELLIVIDNSGSMKANMDFLKEVVSIIKVLAGECEEDITISYLIFNEDVQIIDVFDGIQIIDSKETCIMQGIEATDQWMEKKIEEGSNVKVLFISDLFSSRYLDNGQVKKYDVNYAKKEQGNILRIEDKWKEWCTDRKANILIWTWESFCTTEKKENTIDNLEKNNADEISWGYQVKFEPVENTVISVGQFEETDRNIEFIKKAVESFEILLGSSEVKWETYYVNQEAFREMKLDEKEKNIYLLFPNADDIQIKYNDAEVESQYNGLYLLDQKEHKYYVKAQTNAGKIEGYKLIVPDLEWKIRFSDGVLKKNKEFIVILSPSAQLGGSWENPTGYNCSLKVLDQIGDEIGSWNMEYNPEEGCFCVKRKMEAGIYTFIGVVNGKEVDRKGMSVN